MAKITAVQTNFTAGELTPRMRARVDVARYNNGAEIIENGWPVIHGGIEKRWGTVFAGPVKHADKRARLHPFVFSRTQAYWLEFGDGYMRVHTDAGQVLASPGVPYEIATPYAEADLAGMDFSQGADTMIVWHASKSPRRLRRFADDSWVLDLAPLDPPPFDEVGDRFNIGITLSAATVGTGRTANAASAVFLAADIGRQIWAGVGVATITAVASGTSATVDITSAFAGVSLAGNTWSLTFSPQTACTPSGTGPVGSGIALVLSANGWRASDVGKHVKINNGLARISAYTDPLNVSAVVLTVLNTTVASQANAWTLNGSAWNDVDGYPSTGTFHAQRLVASGSPAYPKTVWGSAIGEPYNFQNGTLDTDAFAYQLASDDVSQITYLCSLESLVALSYGGEFTLDGGVEKPITPTNVRAKPRTNHGCAQVRPIKVGKEEVFVQRTGKRVRAASYNENSGEWAAPDISVLSDHLTKPGVVSLSWHAEPGTLIFAASADGALNTCTFDRDQDVAGWARHNLGGVVESVATIPVADGDRTMVLIRRTINGATVRYLEKFDQATYVDSAINGTAGTPTAVWSGLDHLEGQTVAVQADGVKQVPQVVTGGQITLPRPASVVQIGLAIRMRIKLLPPEVSGGSGAAKGAKLRAHALLVEMLDTIGMTINGEEVTFRQLGDGVLDQAPEPFTGIKDVTDLGWEDGTLTVEITHDDPLPCHVLAVIRKISVNEG